MLSLVLDLTAGAGDDGTDWMRECMRVDADADALCSKSTASSKLSRHGQAEWISAAWQWFSSLSSSSSELQRAQDEPLIAP